MIREYRNGDIDEVMKIWLAANTQAHAFIPARYWKDNFAAVKKQIAQATVYVYEIDGAVRGFIGLSGEYIEGLFVSAEYRSQGIGKHLLEAVKKNHDTLVLHVYEKNKRALAFYLREQFVVQKRQQTETKEIEIAMQWKR